MQLKPVSILFLCNILLCCVLTACDGIGSQSAREYTFEETAFKGDSLVDTLSGHKTLTLHLVVNETYCKATACECIKYLASREYDDIITTLKTSYNIDLQLRYCIEEDSIEHLLRTGEYDGAICKPWLACRLIPETGLKFTRIADIPDPFDEGLLHGVFIVKKESSLFKPEDIKGKSVAIGLENSYEKYHLAMRSLHDRSIKPGKLIKRGSCTENLDLLIEGQADVACISDYALIASCAVDFAQEEAFRVILKTDSIPLCSVIVDLSKVDSTSAIRLQQALLKLSAEKVPESFASKGFIIPIPWTPALYEEKQNRVHL